MIGIVVAAVAGAAAGLIGGAIIGGRNRKYYESQIQEYESLLNRSQEIISRQQQALSQAEEEIQRLRQERLRLLMNWISSERDATKVMYLRLIESGEFKDYNQLITLKFRMKFLNDILNKFQSNIDIPQEDMELIEKLSSNDPTEKALGEVELMNKFSEEEVLNEFYKTIKDKMFLIQKKIQELENQKIEKESEIEALKMKEEIEGLNDKEKEKLEELLKELKYITADLERYEEIFNQNRNFIALAAATVYYKGEEYVEKAVNILKKAFKGQYLTNKDKETLNLIAQMYLPKVKDKIRKHFETGGEESMIL